MKSIGRAAALVAVLGMPVVAYVLAQVAASMWGSMDPASLADVGLALQNGLAFLAAAVGSAVAAYLAFTGYAMLLGAVWRGGRSIPNTIASLAPHGWARVTATALGLTMTAGLTAPALAATPYNSAVGIPSSSAGWVAAPASLAVDAKAPDAGRAGASSSPRAVGWIAPDARGTSASADLSSLHATSGSNGAPLADAGPEPSDDVPRDTPGNYTVQPGNSLWLITHELLGADAESADIAAAWPQLYEANHDAIGEDPSLIHPGVVLTIPAGIGA